ncbi:hypothetical protein DN069_22705 [Streptacidiphilus pinicola]|uniref:Uncharacterized protein n=1 Tax=Streptacidiphilus pinicola TaxID=2219663 RepID=A0A2X0IEC1_9ACTN|nr:GAF domain-containing SpoIIE family protein phosphatase [Streptacidiphilus pinicola]RAG83334.1 hypothetical protein DN069_22705 [Streptacidiphilus pinicola]
MAEEHASARHSHGAPDPYAAEQLRRLRKSDTLDALDEQVREVALGYRRLRRLLDAVVTISTDLDGRVVLKRIVDAACDLVDARYGAIEVLGPTGGKADLITAGVDEQHLRQAFGIPERHGLLDTLATDPRPLRVADLASHPGASGFPPGHPVMTTLLAVPLMVRGTMYGYLYLADKRDGTPFTDGDETLLTALASGASVSIENARLYQGLKHAAEQFQLRMLPTLPDLGPLEIDVRYEPASEVTRLGGDWYDALTLPDGATCVVVGDVTGHDVEAAPLMGQIRNMLRALVYDHGGPTSLVLSKLDHALTMFPEPPTATLVLGRIEEADGAYTLHWSNAGHPPPLLVGADGSTRYLAPSHHGIPVGIDPAVPRYDHAHPLPAGSTLLLFTDGLVERRGEDIDVGLTALAGHAGRLARAPLREVCSELVAGPGPARDDDVAVLALRTPNRRRG